MPLTWAAKLMSFNPARHFRIDHRKGALEIGRDADITVLADKPIVYDGAASGNNVVGWSPYNGISCHGPWLRPTCAASLLSMAPRFSPSPAADNSCGHRCFSRNDCRWRDARRSDHRPRIEHKNICRGDIPMGRILTEPRY